MRALIAAYLAVAGPSLSAAPALEPWRTAPPSDRAFVLRLARRAFREAVLERRRPSLPQRLPDRLQGRCGVFVSAMRNGAPRCCMGSLHPTEPDLVTEIAIAAGTAACRDLRFPPVRPAELPGLTLIVSFVAPDGSITKAEALRLDPTRQGLAVRAPDGRVGVTLSGETTDAATMLAWACTRAGVRSSAGVQCVRLDVVRLVEGRDDRLP